MRRALSGRREFGGRAEHDWVVRGEHIQHDKLVEARRQWRTFIGMAPEYPEKVTHPSEEARHAPACLRQLAWWIIGGLPPQSLTFPSSARLRRRSRGAASS